MKQSIDRILVTHTGRLERPQALTDQMAASADGRPTDSVFNHALTAAVDEVVKQQADAGIDVVTDGEFGKLSWQSYITSRLTGWEKTDTAPPRQVKGKDRRDFAQYYADTAKDGVHYFKNPEGARPRVSHPVFTSAIRYVGQQHVQTDIANLKRALQGVQVEEASIQSVAPGSIRFENRFYVSDEEYVFALAEALREEYRAIVDAGFVLHVDDPIITALWELMLPDIDLRAFNAACAVRIAALNHALTGIAPDRVRVHVCWGSWHGPHSTDMPLEHLIPLINKMNVGGYVLEAGNVRHEHEWQVWSRSKLPEGRVLIPGVVSHSTDTLEHPELIAWRLQQFATAVGRENIIAGTDCGMGYRVHPQIAWAKLKVLKEGADLASKRLWAAR